MQSKHVGKMRGLSDGLYPLTLNLNPESSLYTCGCVFSVHHPLIYTSVKTPHFSSASHRRCLWNEGRSALELKCWEPRSPEVLGGSGSFLVKLADSCSQHTWDTNLKRKKEVVKVMLFCKLQRLSLPPPLYILLSGELTCLQLLAETVFRGVKPASSRPIKLQQGTRTGRCGRPRPGCPLMIPLTPHAEKRERSWGGRSFPAWEPCQLSSAPQQGF